MADEDRTRNINRLPTDSVIVLQKFADKNRTLYYRFLLKKVRHAVNNDMDAIDLFRFANTSNIAQIKRERYIVLLDIMMKYFVEQEEYEYAEQVRKVIDKTKVNDVVKPK